MMRPTAVVFLLLLCLVSSCDEDCSLEDCRCHCHDNGNSIGGWDDGKDSTVVNKKDTVGGFDVTVDGWSNSETHDIIL